VWKKPNGDVHAFCPAHPDGKKHGMKSGQSLVYHEKSGVLKCYAGCTFAEVLAALKVERAPEPLRSPSAPLSLRKVAEYTYALQDGGTAVKERWEGEWQGNKRNKEFKWPTGTKMDNACLYRIEDIGEGLVWFTEGEKACDALRNAGEKAVCAGGGAGQKDFGNAFEPLVGRTVVIWPDNDDIGRRYRDVVRAELERVGADPRVFQPTKLPDGGDAHDFFAQGRSLDEYHKRNSPQVTTTPEGVEVVVPTETFPVSFRFTPYARSRGEFDVELTVTLQMPFPKAPLHQRLNLLSQSATRDLRMGMDAQFGKDVKWAGVIGEAIALFRQEYVAQRRSVVEAVGASDEYQPPRRLLGKYIVEQGGTFLFGPPGAGKSTTGMLWAISMDYGTSRFWPTQQAKTLYVNLERSAEQLKFLYTRCLDVLDVPRDHRMLMLNARGKTLADVLDIVKESTWRDGVEVVVVDSISRAGYGNLNDNEVGNRGADALNALGITWAAIGHSPRGDDTHIYGTIMWEAAADVLVSTTGEQNSEVERGVMLQVTKSNHFGLPKPETWAYEYDDAGLISVEKAAVGQFSELEGKKREKAEVRVAQFLEAGAADASTIALELDLNRSNVSSLLSRSPRFTVVRREGKAVLYGNVLPNSEGNTKATTGVPERVVVSDNTIGATQQHITCSNCKREGVALFGYHGDSTPEKELPLCAGCVA